MGIRSGRGRVLVLRGDAGVGKTALLRYASDRGSDFQVVEATGVESELELAFAGLYQLCAPLLDRLDRLPPPQREALVVAFGMSEGAAPDRFLVGLAVLSLLTDAAERRPVLCLIDDAQWMDAASAQALAFVARRLLAEPIAMIFASRPADSDPLRGLPELPVLGLKDVDARELLAAALPRPLDTDVLEQIVAESRGNPLALLELPKTWVRGDAAGGFALPDSSSPASRVQEGYVERLALLPDSARLVLLIAAAEPSGDPVLLWRAAGILGTGFEAAAPAEAAGFIDFGIRVRFRHPLIRSIAYWSASSQERQRIHRALAQATDPAVDPDRRAWHRAQGTSGVDEEVAAELERSADSARARGGLAAAAAFLQGATRLTPDPTRRAARALAAAQVKHQTGASSDATALLAVAQAGPLDALQKARVDLLRGQLAFSSSCGHRAPPILLSAARQLERLDATLSRDTYLEAFAATQFVGRLAGDVGVTEVAAAVRASPLPRSQRAQDLLLDGLASLIAEGYETGAPALKRAVAAFRSTDDPEAARWLWLATHAAHDLWDDESWDVLSARHIGLARQTGALAILPIALNTRVGLLLFAGELTAAHYLVQEIATVTEATGNRLPPYGEIALAAWQGREAETRRLTDAVLEDVSSRGEGLGLTLVQHAQAVLYNGLGRYHDALHAAERAAEQPHELAFSTWSLVQLIEAAVRTGQRDRAVIALERLSVSTRASGTEWALGIEARSRALVSDSEAAEHFYVEALQRLSRTRVPMEQARAQLVYGEWLRHEGRNSEAREHLRAAHIALSTIGADAFAERARRELLAAGETVHARRADATDDLSAQESQIALLAAQGLTNPEIGAQLFISSRTVEWHLRKVFGKLGVTSRKQIRDVLPKNASVGAPV